MSPAYASTFPSRCAAVDASLLSLGTMRGSPIVHLVSIRRQHQPPNTTGAFIGPASVIAATARDTPMTSVRRAVLLSVGSQYSVQFVQVVSMVVIARLMTPAEVGIFAIAGGVIVVATTLRELGVGQYLIREKEISDEKIRSAAGVMMLTSWLLGALVALGAPTLAAFYGEPGLTDILHVSVLAFLLAPFASVPYAILNREMQFGPLLKIHFATALSHSVVAIGLLWFGMSFMALAWAGVASAVVELVLILYYTPRRLPWMPSLRKAGAIVRFGVLAMTGSVLRQFSPSLPDMVLGRAATMTDVGIFSRGLGVIMFMNQISNQALSPVVLPYLSKVHRDGDSVADAYKQAVALQTGVSWPMFAGVSLLAAPMILLLFGDQWGEAAPIAAVLSIWGALQAVHYFASDALVAVGRERLMVALECTVFLARAIAIIVAAPYGLMAVAWSVAAVGLIELFVGSWAMREGMGLAPTAMLVALGPSAMVAGICWISIWSVTAWLATLAISSIVAMFAAALVSALVWFGALLVTRHPLGAELVRLIPDWRGRT
jgi:O-antigen/teichoic acid export membrane protein